MTYRDADTQAAQAAVLALRSRQCRWPIGHVDEPDFRFCQADAIPGSRYCACHDWDSRAVKRGRRPPSMEFAFVEVRQDWLHPDGAKKLAPTSARCGAVTDQGVLDI